MSKQNSWPFDYIFSQFIKETSVLVQIRIKAGSGSSKEGLFFPQTNKKVAV